MFCTITPFTCATERRERGEGERGGREGRERERGREGRERGEGERGERERGEGGRERGEGERGREGREREEGEKGGREGKAKSMSTLLLIAITHEYQRSHHNYAIGGYTPTMWINYITTTSLRHSKYHYDCDTARAIITVSLYITSPHLVFITLNL